MAYGHRATRVGPVLGVCACVDVGCLSPSRAERVLGGVPAQPGEGGAEVVLQFARYVPARTSAPPPSDRFAIVHLPLRPIASRSSTSPNTR